MPFDASTAEPVAAQSGFDPATATQVAPTPGFDAASAEPVPVNTDVGGSNPFALNEADFKAASPLGRLKMMVEHPWDKYVASVDQAFQGPLKPTRIQAEPGAANIPAQVGAAGVNLAQAVGTGAVSPGAAAAVVSPGTILYSVPRFVVGGAQDIYDAVKGAVEGTGGVQETLEKGVGGAVQVAGGVVAGAHGLRGEVAPKTPQEAADAVRVEAQKTTDPQAKDALEAAAQKIETKAAEGVKFDPSTAEPVTVKAEEPLPGVVLPFDETTATPVAPGEQTTFDFTAPENVAKTSELPKVGEGDSSTYGIAARVSEARAASGNIEPIEPGEGVSTEETITKARQDLKAGADPQAALDRFNQTGAISAEDVALARARGEQLAKAASDAGETHGINSPEYKAAAAADSEWTKAIKPMQTEWAKIGQAQQGETDIDTGTYHGLRSAFQDATGKDFTPEQSDSAVKIAEGVKQATADVDAAKAKVLDAIANEVPDAPKTKGLGLSAAIHDAAEAARARIRERMGSGRISSGLDPQDLADHAIVGAEYIAKGIDNFADWSKAMGEEFGERIKPYLQDIFDSATAKANDMAGVTKGSVADIWSRAKDYINKGETDFDDIRHKIAADTGLSVDEVTRKLAEPKSTRVITNDMYAKMAARQQIVNSAKTWLRDQATPGWLRFARMLPSSFFKLATFGHGTVGMITHAGFNIFDPVVAKPYWTNFFRQYKLLGWHDQGAYHERMMQDLARDPNYVTARRAGLANDPHRYMDDYQSGWLTGYFKRIGLMGNRGFDALKLYRQDRFNMIWDQMPSSLHTPDMAKLVADSVNHATGVVKARFGEWANWTFFAPKLEGSRWAWMIGDPLKAGKIIAGWKDATPAEQQFALREVRQKATVTGIYLGLLATNQGLLSASGSKQQINFTNPERSDFLAFKAGDHNFGVVSPMLGLVRLFANLIHASVGKRTKFEQQTPRAEAMGNTVVSYVRGKFSPFAGNVTNVVTQADYAKRPLPFSNDKVPAYLRKQGEQKYTYPEYIGENLTPIPVEEAVREVWRKQGMAEGDIEHWMKALAAAAVMGGTGARMTPDTHIGQPVNPRR